MPPSAVVIGGLFFFYLGYSGQVADYLSLAWTDFRDRTRAYGRVAVMLGPLLGIAFGAMGSWLIGKWLTPGHSEASEGGDGTPGPSRARGDRSGSSVRHGGGQADRAGPSGPVGKARAGGRRADRDG